MVTVKTKEEIEVLREGGERLAGVLKKVVESAKPGVSAYDLDWLAEELIFSSGGEPAFKGYKIKETNVSYPASLCVSINDEVVHGIPRKDKILKDGDVVGIDIGMWWPKVESRKPKAALATDMAVTIGIGKTSKEAERLIRVTKESLDIGIKAVKPGIRIGDVSHAVQKHLEKYDLGIIRDLAGHGVGYELHEEPLVPNYGKPGTGLELKEGMVIAIEPMATLGGWRVSLDDDEWTFRTADGSLAAHFEHTIVVTAHGSEILTENTRFSIL